MPVPETYPDKVTKADFVAVAVDLNVKETPAGATAKAAAAQAAAVQRDNHTGTQAQSTVVGLEAAIAAKLDAAAASATYATQAALAAEASARSAAEALLQPLDSDLTAIAALSTTAYGRAFLALADAAAGRTALGLGTAATTAATAYDVAGAAAAAQAASQPVDSDLTAIAALTTTSYGRAFLALADAAAARTALALGELAVKSAIAVPTDVTATGTPSATTYLRGDGSWATPSGAGGADTPQRALGKAGDSITPTGLVATGTPISSNYQASGIAIPPGRTIDRVAVNVTAASTAGVVGSIGVYDDDNGWPAARLGHATFDPTATGVKEVTFDPPLVPGSTGVVWICAGASSSAATVTMTQGRQDTLIRPVLNGAPMTGQDRCSPFMTAGVTPPSTWPNARGTNLWDQFLAFRLRLA